MQVEVVTSRSRPEYAAHEVLEGIPVHRLPFVRVRRVATLSALVTLAYFLWRRRRHFDVVHAHTVHYYAAVATGIAWLLGKPVVLKAVGWWELQHGILSPGRRGRLDTRICLALLRQADVWIALSDELREAMLLAGVPPARVHFVPNGVDTARYRPGSRSAARRRLGIAADGRHVVFVGRLVAEKGLVTLLRGWPAVVAEVSTAHLHIVGEGVLRRHLEDESRRLGITDTVTFHGDQPGVITYLQAANCFVLPSTIEGMSNALLEAMAVGLPLVATHIPGTEALVKDGHNGVLVRADDPHELAHAIVALLNDPGRAATLGARARAYIEKQFGIEKIAETYRRFYRAEVSG